jgi:2-polyprenyl-6-methoxyphenol hydroxylase-like FAD-dependent oxidoreductase
VVSEVMMFGQGSHKLGSHAVVVGGSMAGLSAARVCAERFERVTLVERDVLSSGSAEPRKGVPQGRQVHALLKRGEQIFDRLFPGFSDGLRAAGAESMRFGGDFAWYHFGAFKLRPDAGFEILSASRPLIEREARVRLAMLANVRILDGTDLLGLTINESSGRVTGANVRHREDGVEEKLVADLVVDATGRGSATPRWLEAIGRGRPQESVVKVDVCYATRIYRRPPPGTHDWKALYVLGHAPDKRLGVIFPIEGERWMALLAGMLGDHPPSDAAGWSEYARQLAHPSVYDALQGTEPLCDPVLYKFPSHLRRHYERMSTFPEGFAVLGDSHCSFNPIYGQGITTAAIGAETLESELSSAASSGRGLDGFSWRFQRALAQATDDPWMMSTGEDLRYPEVEGARTFGTGLMQWYTARVHRAAGRDPEVARGFFRTMQMLEPPTALLTPSVALRVLLSGGPQT